MSLSGSSFLPLPMKVICAALTVVCHRLDEIFDLATSHFIRRAVTISIKKSFYFFQLFLFNQFSYLFPWKFAVEIFFAILSYHLVSWLHW